MGTTTAPRVAASASSGAGATAQPGDTGDSPPLTERPEVLLGAALAGGFVLARILRAITN